MTRNELFAYLCDDPKHLKRVYSVRSQSVGATERALGDSGRSCVKETARECSPPRPTAEETQTSLSVTF